MKLSLVSLLLVFLTDKLNQASATPSTEVVYKIRQWSLPGAAVMPVLNVSSRVTWLELDDKALLESYAVLQEGILCDVSQKCSAAWSWTKAHGRHYAAWPSDGR